MSRMPDDDDEEGDGERLWPFSLVVLAFAILGALVLYIFGLL
jgi:hypothetical protein